MHEHVLIKIVLDRKESVADRAVEWLLSGVHVHMDSQIFALGERLVAEITNEWGSIGIRETVLLEIGGCTSVYL